VSMQVSAESEGPKTFAQAINLALHDAMHQDPSVFVFGLGAADPGAVFGTTAGLVGRYGSDRVFDGPTSENAMTGVAVGAALGGLRPVTSHQRFDFFLLAMDQLVNAAAKWHYMFGGKTSVPLVIRVVVGRGWGQGPTHSQNLQSWLAHIPGLRVIVPTFPKDAYGLLRAAIRDPNPVVLIEHRWLHNVEGEMTQDPTTASLDKSRIIREGNEVTVVATGELVLEALEASKWLETQGLSVEVIDLRTVNPIDWETIFESIDKTKRLLVCDSSHATCSVGSEIVARVSREKFESLINAPALLAKPDSPEPTSFGLSKDFTLGAERIAESVLKIFKTEMPLQFGTAKTSTKHDVPGEWFKGPF